MAARCRSVSRHSPGWAFVRYVAAYDERMSTRERLTVSLPADLVRDIRSATGGREVSAYVERAVRHEMLLSAAYPEIPDDARADFEALHDEARGWTPA